MAWWKIWESNRADGEPKTFNIVLGYFFLINFCIGTGFLGVPYAFFYSGYLAAIPTLIFTAFSSYITSRWLIEVVSRAQAVESFTQTKTGISRGGTDKGCDYQNPEPNYKISKYRKFENVELSQMFVGKWFKYFYLISFSIYAWLTNWSFASVAATAWASNIPYNFGRMTLCDDSAFHHRILPTGGCLYSYYFSLVLFGVIVTTLSIMDLKEQLIVQVLMGLVRFLAIFAIVFYSFYHLINANGSDACEGELPFMNATLVNESYTPLFNASLYISYEEIVKKFDPRGWIVSVPIFLYAFEIQSAISSLTHPVKQKKYIHWLLAAVFATSLSCFMSLGIIVPLWFKASVQETVTLNWVSYTYAGNPPQLRALSYFLILFPSLDVMSAYPLVAICIANNIYMVITGRDTSEKGKWKYDWLLRLCIRFFSAILPLALGFTAANLVFILTYTGLLGFVTYFLVPVVLQLCSIYVCKKMFSRQSAEPEKSSGSIIMLREETKSTPSETKPEKQSGFIYMTPYSNIVCSHPIFVAIIGFFGFCFFVISILSIFIGPEKLTCEYE